MRRGWGFALLLNVLGSPGWTQPAVGVEGTVHDLSVGGYRSPTAATKVCIFCHAAHISPGGQGQLIPAWNRTTTSTSFRMYNQATSPELRGSVDAQPLGPSLACLSCHDGTVAMGSLLEVPEDGGHTTYSGSRGGVDPVSGRMIGPGVLGSDLTRGHPISVSYRDDLNKGLVPAASVVAVRLYPQNATGSRVHCSSCHDVHNFGTPGGTAPFLRATKAGSTLCTCCHQK